MSVFLIAHIRVINEKIYAGDRRPMGAAMIDLVRLRGAGGTTPPLPVGA